MSNPSAFPIPNDPSPGAYPAEPGMGLRDYFAAKAMQAIIAKHPPSSVPVTTSDGWEESVSAGAYAYAAAMMIEREKQPNNSKDE